MLPKPRWPNFIAVFCLFFSSRRRHTRFDCDWSSDVCSSDLAGDRSKDLLTHDRGARRGIEEQLRRQIGRTGLAAGEGALLDRRPRATGDGRAHLRTYRVRRGGAHHRAERGLSVQRVAEPVLLNQLDAAAREALMDALVNVDALQPAAGLTGG